MYDMCVWSMTTCIVYDVWCMICVSSLTLWLYVLCMMYICVWSMTIRIAYDIWCMICVSDLYVLCMMYDMCLIYDYMYCVWSMIYDMCVWSITICIVYDLRCMICVSDLWLYVTTIEHLNYNGWKTTTQWHTHDLKTKSRSPNIAWIGRP